MAISPPREGVKRNRLGSPDLAVRAAPKEAWLCERGRLRYSAARKYPRRLTAAGPWRIRRTATASRWSGRAQTARGCICWPDCAWCCDGADRRRSHRPRRGFDLNNFATDLIAWSNTSPGVLLRAGGIEPSVRHVLPSDRP